MKSSVVVSVVIPTWNRSRVITKAIQSVLLQKKIDWELIIVDDGSTDDTLDVIQDFIKDNRISYIYLDHSGVSRARNKGVEVSKGKWISFLDSDDEWKKDKLFKQYQAIKFSQFVWNQTKEIWIRNGLFVNQPKLTQKKAGCIFNLCLDRCMVTPSSVMIKKSIFEKMGGFDEKYQTCEDYELWLRFSSQFEIGLIEENLLIRHGGHADQLSTLYPSMDRFRIQAIDKILNSKVLTLEQSQACLQVIKKKLQIYLQGCEKRQKWEEKPRWEKLYQKYL